VISITGLFIEVAATDVAMCTRKPDLFDNGVEVLELASPPKGRLERLPLFVDCHGVEIDVHERAELDVMEFVGIPVEHPKLTEGNAERADRIENAQARDPQSATVVDRRRKR
jgi:hypothetical protein